MFLHCCIAFTVYSNFIAFDYRRAFCACADKYVIVFGGFWHISEIETAFLGDFHNLEPAFNQH